ncbi:MAG: hypothetical protein M3462_14700, partial [Chloroflexota bacterium]|nr:hypothetical protein [Chloroflexota bacterium]
MSGRVPDGDAILERDTIPEPVLAGEDDGPARRPGWPRGGSFWWLAATVALAAWLAFLLGITDVWVTVQMPGGETTRIPDTLASVDHPFHATRAATLLDALRGGDWPRWVSDHQGGYPAEFYPLGVAWLEVGVWAATLGTVPIAFAHKATVILVFLLPLVGFTSLARTDRVSGAVAFLAAAAHLAIPGEMFAGGHYGGGYAELFGWGLVTNVAAATFLFVALPPLLRWGGSGHLRAGGAAICLVGLALVTNPRSAIALATALAAVVVVLGAATGAAGRRRVIFRIGIAAVVPALLAAPVLVSLVRYDDLYYFARYSWYEGAGGLVSATVATVTLPVAIAAVVGAIVAAGDAARPGARAVTLCAGFYIATTIGLNAARDSSAFDQLEATRLMPFQRLLLLYLAAFGTVAVVGAVVNRAGRGHRGVVGSAPAVVAAGVALAILAGVLGRPGFERAESGVAPDPVTTADPTMVSLERAVRLADEIAPEGTALYVVGSSLSWHQQLWAPTWTDRPVRYDDWLWFWHPLQAAPDYRLAQGNAFSRTTVAQTMMANELGRRGIGAVVVTRQDALASADDSAALELVTDGDYRVYRVLDPVPLVTFDDGTVASVSVEPGRV